VTREQPRKQPGESSRLRADAVRNREQIRAAALRAFRGRGLNTPLDEIAAAAGVSKATIYNRFDGRQGLIDAVIEDVVATDVYQAIERARGLADPWERIVSYVTDHRDLQYREPAALDVILMDYPESPRFVAVCDAAKRAARELVEDGHQAGVLRQDFTVDDFNHATIANALTLRHWPRPSRADYDRRTRQFLDAIRGRAASASADNLPTGTAGPRPLPA
jgi:AcrR family transcriptional regulator